ncbi:F0F1 ATP synthase subunit A [Mesoplasma chauliocola]|uniref:F0F1 ATP synthase subunit A n=1 Tax=Mesoplasma chauliocola TaxID=216427 RepID=A0A249SMQ0_9MOLU|nr:F0F1 ATP synthase subunit A [Mesoplasma chauliocola]ASZ08869.1 F0F1 ATP synthase subunit A [Mesoplasma chauliocola]
MTEGLWEFTTQFSAIIITTILICAICITYNVKVRGQEEDKELSGLIVLVDMFISSVENLVVSIMGKKYRKLTPYFLYICLYIVVGSLVSLLGFESPSSSYTVTLSMAFVTFVLIYYFAFRYQKWAYLKRYINPMEIFTQFTPLLSMSFRLFGNLLGGSIILGLVYALFIGFQSGWAHGTLEFADGQKHWPTFGMWNAKDPLGNLANGTEAWTLQYTYWWSGLNIFTSAITPFLHMYFDMFDAVIQAVVFTMLSLSYWAQGMGEEQELTYKNEEKNSSRKTQKLKRIELQN